MGVDILSEVDDLIAGEEPEMCLRLLRASVDRNTPSDRLARMNSSAATM